MEELNVKRLADGLLMYLRNELRNQSIQYSSPPTPLTGGYVTNLYKFQLKDVSEELSKPLVLRLYPKSHPAGQAFVEGNAQNVLFNASYPAPRVFFICSDTTVLGEEFIIMEFMPGEMMMHAYSIEIIPKMLAKIHVDLHRIDPKPIVEALTEKGFFSRTEKGSFSKDLTSFIGFLETKIRTMNLTWLKPGLQWVKENRPTENIKHVINHGDFHPFNILVDHGEISAVLDWSGFCIGEPELDVANTKSKLTCIAPSAFPDIDWMQFINRYYECYLNEWSLDQGKVEYYEAAYCLRLLVLTEMGFGERIPSLQKVEERIINRFKKITGINLKRTG